jgi:heme oxygenase (biliverdin-IX-beta and delta-forming)
LPTESGLLSELRQRTRDEHDRIEALLRLTDPMSLPRYAGIVSGFHAFLSRWEPRLAQALPLHLHDWCLARGRSTLAAQDMHDVSAAPSDALSQAARQAVEVVPLHDTAQAFGSMYVIEGSALGGQVITPLLERHLGLTPAHGARYFHGHGPRTGAMWREFREVITHEVGAGDAAIDAACDSARRTFAALRHVFQALPA